MTVDAETGTVTLFAPDGRKLFTVSYDPATTLYQEALENVGMPDVVAMVRQSYLPDGDGWTWDHKRKGKVCQGYLARFKSVREQSELTQERKKAMAKRKPEPAKPPEMKVVSYTRDLKVSLTPPEVAERADRAARLLEDRDRAEAELKSYATTVKGRIATMEAEMRELSGEVRNKFTYREVECERRFIFTTGLVQEVRLDTEEVLTERAMTEKEKQRDLPFDRVTKPEPEPQDAAAE